MSGFKNCDSLRHNLHEWTESNIEKDSLYDAVISNQSDQLTIKDSLTALQDLRYKNLDGLFKQSLLQQELLADQYKKEEASFKRQQVKTKLLSGFIVIAAGIAAHYLIK